MNDQQQRPTPAGPHQGRQVLTAGVRLQDAHTAMILVHGRGAGAADILGLGRLLMRTDMHVMAPQAAGNTWYPYSFLAPMEENEPGLSSGLQVLEALVAKVEAAGVPADRLVIGGFSQGACLASEFAARNARRYGALLAFSGGLIGPPGTPRDYPGNLSGTPVFIGCSDTDFHIPLARVQETADRFRLLGGDVTERIYPNMAHTIIQDEINLAREMLHAI